MAPIGDYPGRWRVGLNFYQSTLGQVSYVSFASVEVQVCLVNNVGFASPMVDRVQNISVDVDQTPSLHNTLLPVPLQTPLPASIHDNSLFGIEFPNFFIGKSLSFWFFIP
jgi:hypothetical protein